MDKVLEVWASLISSRPSSLGSGSSAVSLEGHASAFAEALAQQACVPASQGELVEGKLWFRWWGHLAWGASRFLRIWESPARGPDATLRTVRFENTFSRK